MLTLTLDREAVLPYIRNEKLPRMFRARQTFPRPCLAPEDIPARIESQVRKQGLEERICPGMRVAITVGSRGITNEALITRSIVELVKRLGGEPFIVPAMGSHGGATAEGQREILAGYQITEEAMGCPILSSMDTVCIGRTESGQEVVLDRHAAQADGIIVNCRIKPHTAFRGPYESGIMKMMTIGLAKQRGADICHADGFQHMAKHVAEHGRAVLRSCPILFAVAAIENAYDETADVVVRREDIEREEPRYLEQAKRNMPRILTNTCDILVVDRIGKNFSGDGMDPNISGRFGTPYANGGVRADKVAVLDLSPETHGNGLGVGNADVTTRRLAEQLDLASMYINGMTSRVVTGVRIPVVMENDREVIQFCLASCAGMGKAGPRVVRLRDTSFMEHILLSEAFLPELADIEGLEAEGEPEEMVFDAKGNLVPFPTYTK